MKARYATLTTPIKAQTAAAIARPLSKPVRVATAGTAARGAGAGAAAGRGAVAEAPGGAERRLVPLDGGAGGLGAALETGAAAAELGGGGAPAGKVGNLIVGAAVGLGGKLMRTVSFLG